MYNKKKGADIYETGKKYPEFLKTPAKKFLFKFTMPGSFPD